MDEITTIAYNCRKATFLIEKKQIAEISLREKLELKIHLAGCSICRTFEEQSLLINEMVRNLISKTGQKEFQMDQAFKKHLQEMIEERWRG